MFEVDTLIIGQGLAGSLLAWRLIGRGERVLVVDNGHASSSSKVAAGLINPVTGKRLVKSAGVDTCLPTARETYGALERLLGLPLLVDKPMLRLFHSQEERERWQQRLQQPGYAEYLGELLEPSQLPQPVLASHGAGKQLQTSYLRTTPLLPALRRWLQQQQAYRCAAFDYAALELHGRGVHWCDVTALRVIFCEGYKVMENPWFDWLPLQPAKGEFLTVHCDRPLPDLIINSGRWLMPRGYGLYRVGASYDHRQLDEQITTEVRQMLLDALPTFLAGPPQFQVVSQQAGVRPTTSDRGPLLGRHPLHSQLMVFNGFGSKGSLLIPWHAERLVGHLLDGDALPAAADIARLVRVA